MMNSQTSSKMDRPHSVSNNIFDQESSQLDVSIQYACNRVGSCLWIASYYLTKNSEAVLVHFGKDLIYGPRYESSLPSLTIVEDRNHTVTSILVGSSEYVLANPAYIFSYTPDAVFASDVEHAARKLVAQYA